MWLAIGKIGPTPGRTKTSIASGYSHHTTSRRHQVPDNDLVGPGKPVGGLPVSIAELEADEQTGENLHHLFGPLGHVDS